jgi:hypothetical protein
MHKKHLFRGLPIAPFAVLLPLSLLLGACTKCEPVAPAANAGAAATGAPASQRGVITVEASISTGTRFTLYTNDIWKEPHTVPVTPGQFVTYRFDVPPTLTSLRLDPSEKPEAVAVIRKIRILLPGAPSAVVVDLSELPKWLMDHCMNTYNPKDGTVTLRATGPYMNTMSTVWVNTMRAD